MAATTNWPGAHQLDIARFHYDKRKSINFSKPATLFSCKGFEFVDVEPRCFSALQYTMPKGGLQTFISPGTLITVAMPAHAHPKVGGKNTDTAADEVCLISPGTVFYLKEEKVLLVPA